MILKDLHELQFFKHILMSLYNFKSIWEQGISFYLKKNTVKYQTLNEPYAM